MAYTPVPPATLIPGYPGNGAYWPTLLDNADDAYLQYAPTVMNALTKWATGSTSFVTVGEWIVPANADQHPIACTIYWRGTTGFTATAALELDDGTHTESAGITSTTTAFATATITLTPSTTDPVTRRARLKIKAGSAGQNVHVAAMVCHYAPATFGAGILASGAAHATEWDIGDGAVPSEVVARMANTIRAAARDRGACIAGGMNHNDSGVAPSPAGPNYDVTGAAWTTVERFIVPYHDPGRRLYRLAVKASGTDPEWRLSVGSHIWQPASATGWSYETPTMALPAGSVGTLALRSTSAGSCAIDTWQILREAA